MLGGRTLDLSRADYQKALGHIPARFLGLIRGFLEGVAAKIDTQYSNAPDLIDNAKDMAIGCALSGLSSLRWYLLCNPGRVAAAEEAWRDSGAVGLCVYLHNLHSSERVLVLSGEAGGLPPADSRSFEEDYTLVVLVSANMNGADLSSRLGIDSVRVTLDFADGEDRAIAEMLDRVAPKAVCVLPGDALGKKLAEEAAARGIPLIAPPFYQVRA